MPQILPMDAVTGVVTPTTTLPSAKLAAAVAAATPETTPIVEAVPTIAVEKPKVDDDATRIGALLRKEKILRAKERQLKEQEENYKRQFQPWQEASELAKSNKLEALKKLGISYDDLTTQMLNGGNLPPEVIAEQKAEAAAQRKFEAFKKQQDDERATEQKKNYEDALKNIGLEAKGLSESSDKFPLVKASEAFNDIGRDIEAEFHRTGRIMSVEEACTKMEQEIYDGLLELSKIDKIRSKLLEVEAPKTPETAKVQEIPKISTLTHKTTAATPATKPLTAAEKRQKAIDVFYGRA